jgi:hypothetical protein
MADPIKKFPSPWDQRLKDAPLIELIIVVLTVHWLLSFFGQSIVPGMSNKGCFTDSLSVVILVLIIIRFLSYIHYE